MKEPYEQLSELSRDYKEYTGEDRVFTSYSDYTDALNEWNIRMANTGNLSGLILPLTIPR